jgi:sugar lactone lactonase YvrE
LRAAAAQPAAAAIAACDTKTTVSTFHQNTGTWYENLEFDGRGGLWVSVLSGSKVERYLPSGAVSSTVDVRDPGAVREGPEGLIYVNAGDTQTGPGEVVRFDPKHPDRPATLYASGFVNANGGGFDRAGNYYVADATGKIFKVRPGGQVDDSWTTEIPSADAVIIAGGQLFTTSVLDPDSAVTRVPLANPAAHQVVTKLSQGTGKLPDDGTIGADGQLYIAAYGSGEIFRINPWNGTTCLLVSGLANPTSIRFADHFGPYVPWRDMFVTQGSGSILRIRLG